MGGDERLRAGSPMIAVGDAAPDFTLPAVPRSGLARRASPPRRGRRDLLQRGLDAALYARARPVRNDYAELAALGAEVVAISSDDLASHAEFAARLAFPSRLPPMRTSPSRARSASLTKRRAAPSVPSSSSAAMADCYTSIATTTREAPLRERDRRARRRVRRLRGHGAARDPHGRGIGARRSTWPSAHRWSSDAPSP